MVYKNCPFCGSKYDKNNKAFDAYPNHLNCTSCGNVFYNNPKPAVAGLIIGDKKIFLTKRKWEPYKDCWDMPGGFMNYGESPDESLKRELKEELDIEISDFNIVGFFNLLYPVRGGDNFSVCVLVFKVVGVDLNKIKVGDDVKDYSFFDKESLPKNIAFTEQENFLRNFFKI